MIRHRVGANGERRDAEAGDKAARGGGDQNPDRPEIIDALGIFCRHDGEFRQRENNDDQARQGDAAQRILVTKMV